MCETDVHAETVGDISAHIIIISQVWACSFPSRFQGAICQIDIYEEYADNLNLAKVISLRGTSINAIRVNMLIFTLDHTGKEILHFFQLFCV